MHYALRCALAWWPLLAVGLRVSDFRSLDRRQCFKGILVFGSSSTIFPVAAGTVQSQETKKVVSESGDFEFQYPQTFEVKSKPVRTHLEEVLVKSGKRQIGVVVDRIKIDSLDDFGTPDFVGQKVIAAEKARDGVTEATLLDARRLDDGTYRIEYTNQSSRGDNHFISRVAVANGRLYVMTCQARIEDFAEAEPGLRLGIESFRVSPANKS